MDQKPTPREKFEFKKIAMNYFKLELGQTPRQSGLSAGVLCRKLMARFAHSNKSKITDFRNSTYDFKCSFVRPLYDMCLKILEWTDKYFSDH